MKPVKVLKGRPSKRLRNLHAHKGVRLPTRARWVLDWTLAWLRRFRRLTIRYAVRNDIHFAVLQLACCLILVRQLSQAL